MVAMTEVSVEMMVEETLVEETSDLPDNGALPYAYSSLHDPHDF